MKTTKMMAGVILTFACILSGILTDKVGGQVNDPTKYQISQDIANPFNLYPVDWDEGRSVDLGLESFYEAE